MYIIHKRINRGEVHSSSAESLSSDELLAVSNNGEAEEEGRSISGGTSNWPMPYNARKKMKVPDCNAHVTTYSPIRERERRERVTTGEYYLDRKLPHLSQATQHHTREFPGKIEVLF